MSTYEVEPRLNQHFIFYMPRYRLLNSNYLHVFNKSIANYEIFRSGELKERFLKTIYYYNQHNPKEKLSRRLKEPFEFSKGNILIPRKNNVIKIFAFIIMPDHYHLQVKVEALSDLSKFISIVENSYARYLNILFKRKGPLWQSRFKYVPITTESEFLHVNRYIHLNASTAGLVEKPEDWEYSSYSDYIVNDKVLRRYVKEISNKSVSAYKKVVENQIDYQKKLKFIKKHLI